jgi:hypothetical protein
MEAEHAIARRRRSLGQDDDRRLVQVIRAVQEYLRQPRRPRPIHRDPVVHVARVAQAEDAQQLALPQRPEGEPQEQKPVKEAHVVRDDEARIRMDLPAERDPSKANLQQHQHDHRSQLAAEAPSRPPERVARGGERSSANSSFETSLMTPKTRKYIKYNSFWTTE